MNAGILPRPILYGMLFVFVASLGLYLLTMPRSITLEDAGLFQMICHNGGIGHPPGYPLFILACQGFVNLPFFDQSVFAGNLLSAMFASAACTVLVLVLYQLKISPWIATCAAMVYAMSATFWSQAIIIEVYSLAVLLFLICLSLCLAYQNRGQPRYLYWLAFVYGLALANHWPLQGLATLALIGVLAPGWSAILNFLLKPVNLLVVAGLLLLGLSPYLVLFQSNPDFAVYGGVETGSDFLKYVSRAAYSDQGELAGIPARVDYQLWLLRQTMMELTLPLMALVVAGCVLSFKRLHLPQAVAVVLLYLGATSILNLMLGFEFNDHRVAIFQPYPVISYLALVIWFAVALEWLADRWSDLQWPGTVLPLVSILVIALGNLPEVNYRDSGFPAIYGRHLLNAVPENAVLFVEGDVGIGVAGYLHYVERLRPDIELRSWNNLVFDNRLVSPFAPLTEQEKARDEFIADSERPVYSTTAHDDQGLYTGLLFQHKVPAGYQCDESLHPYISQLVEWEQQDVLVNGHERELMFGLLLSFTRLHLGLVSTATSSEGLDSEIEILRQLEETFPGKLAAVEHLLLAGAGPGHKEHLTGLVESAVEQMPDRVNARIAALLEEYRGRVALIEPVNLEAAVGHFEGSVVLYPKAVNTSVCPLYHTYRQLGLPTKANDLISRLDGEKKC